MSIPEKCTRFMEKMFGSREEICVQKKNVFGSLKLYSKTKYQDDDGNEAIIKAMVLRNEL